LFWKIFFITKFGFKIWFRAKTKTNLKRKTRKFKFVVKFKFVCDYNKLKFVVFLLFRNLLRFKFVGQQ